MGADETDVLGVGRDGALEAGWRGLLGGLGVLLDGAEGLVCDEGGCGCCCCCCGWLGGCCCCCCCCAG